MRSLAVLLALFAIALQGCGGSGASTAEPSATAEHPPPTLPPPTPTATPPDLKEQLAAYLADLDAQQERYIDTRTKARAALDKADTDGPDVSWTRAADDLKEARDEYNELAVQMHVVEPPPALADAHESLAKSLQLFGQFADTAQSDLRDKDVQAVVAWPQTLGPLSQRVDELRGEWRIETLAYARELDVEVPGWVKKVGTRD